MDLVRWLRLVKYILWLRTFQSSIVQVHTCAFICSLYFSILSDLSSPICTRLRRMQTYVHAISFHCWYLLFPTRLPLAFVPSQCPKMRDSERNFYEGKRKRTTLSVLATHRPERFGQRWQTFGCIFGDEIMGNVRSCSTVFLSTSTYTATVREAAERPNFLLGISKSENPTLTFTRI